MVCRIIPYGHLHRVAYTRGHIDTIDSPDDERVVVQNMWTIGINKCKKKELFVMLVIYKD